MGLTASMPNGCIWQAPSNSQCGKTVGNAMAAKVRLQRHGICFECLVQTVCRHLANRICASPCSTTLTKEIAAREPHQPPAPAAPHRTMRHPFHQVARRSSTKQGRLAMPLHKRGLDNVAKAMQNRKQMHKSRTAEPHGVIAKAQ